LKLWLVVPVSTHLPLKRQARQISNAVNPLIIANQENTAISVFLLGRCAIVEPWIFHAQAHTSAAKIS
jgi:hypothetical protein